MAILMTELCEKGVELIWKQCDEEQFVQGVEYLKEAAGAGDPEALYFLGRCFSWGDGAVGFNDKKAYECYKEGARAGSLRCALGALRAGQYDEEMRSISRHSFEKSYMEVMNAAGQGDSFAAFQIAEALEWEDMILHFDKTGLKKRPDHGKDKCLVWYERAAAGGIVEAMVKAGKCYLNGRFTEENTEKGIYYADQAAARGSAWGLYHMGLYFEEQDNLEAAVEYFQAASIQGDNHAPHRLGNMYLKGRGLPRDIKRAIEELETAAARDNTDCLVELGDIFYRDELVERNDESAFFWYGKAYSAGDKRAVLPLAHLYMSTGEQKDYQKAEKLFLEAAEYETDGSASLVLGKIYQQGAGREPDIEMAVECFEAGAIKGNFECMEILGNLYFEGAGTGRNYDKAFYWFDRLEKADKLQSLTELAFLYQNGCGCEASEERAVELLEKALETECDGQASYELGLIFEMRHASQDDLEVAAECYERAIEMGNENAAKRFSHFKRGLLGRWKVSG